VLTGQEEKVGSMTRRILVATHNKGKVAEYAGLMSGPELAWIGLEEAGVSRDVEEIGTTITENAILKAQSYAVQTGCLTMADDSGLQVDALGGEPGVYTARYGGNGLTPRQRYLLLLDKMRHVSWNDRTARFIAVIAVADEQGRLLGTSEGICPGMIATEPAGEQGFGYDPVFFLPEVGKTLAQLGPSDKQRISHRGKALRAIKPLLLKLLAPDVDQ